MRLFTDCDVIKGPFIYTEYTPALSYFTYALNDPLAIWVTDVSDAR